MHAPFPEPCNIFTTMLFFRLLPFRAWQLFFMFLVQFFLKINAGARKKQTNHQKINNVLHRGNAKCDGQEAYARGTIDDIIDEKQLISNRPPSCSAAKNKQRKATWADLFCCFFELALPLSPDQLARTHRHSERTCAREWSSDGRTSSAFFSVKVNVWPTESYHKQKKTFLGISPRWHVPESTMMGPSAAPVLQ